MKIIILTLFLICMSKADINKRTGDATDSFKSPKTKMENTGSDVGDVEDDDQDYRIIDIFILSMIGCALCCGLLQGVLMLSKKMNGELISLRKNYKQHQGLLKFREFRRAYEKEKMKSGETIKP